MVKVKRRQMAALATDKDSALGGITESSKSGIEGNLHEEDDWVIVKKQKVTILVPPASLVQPTPQLPKTDQVPTKSRRTLKSQSQVLNEIGPRNCSCGDSKNPNPMEKLTKPTLRITSEGPNRLLGESTFRSPSSNFVHDQFIHGEHGPSKAIVASGVTKSVQRTTAPQSTYHQGPTLFLRSVSCLNVGALQNRRMRASNLGRKLEKAGGLSRWLMSLGLGQFVKMFQRKNLGKLQLLNLTMGKLKDMGANAVGPRRKLIHAIDCPSHPYCFNHF